MFNKDLMSNKINNLSPKLFHFTMSITALSAPLSLYIDLLQYTTDWLNHNNTWKQFFNIIFGRWWQVISYFVVKPLKARENFNKSFEFRKWKKSQLKNNVFLIWSYFVKKLQSPLRWSAYCANIITHKWTWNRLIRMRWTVSTQDLGVNML